MGFFKEHIIGPLKFKMAEIRHLENREIGIFQREKIRISMKFCIQQHIR